MDKSENSKDGLHSHSTLHVLAYAVHSTTCSVQYLSANPLSLAAGWPYIYHYQHHRTGMCAKSYNYMYMYNCTCMHTLSAHIATPIVKMLNGSFQHFKDVIFKYLVSKVLLNTIYLFTRVSKGHA